MDDTAVDESSPSARREPTNIFCYLFVAPSFSKPAIPANGGGKGLSVAVHQDVLQHFVLLVFFSGRPVLYGGALRGRRRGARRVISGMLPQPTVLILQFLRFLF